jgi:SAM-dependent methyltransferase
MSRWESMPGDRDGRRYAARFDELAAGGVDVHGEATLCASLVAPGAHVLDAGCGTGRVAGRLATQGYDCVGVDVDPSMLAVARERFPQVTWVEADLASLNLPGRFDLVVAAGNVIPLVAAGAEPTVVARLAAHLGEGGLLLAGFGLDGAHLPLAEAPFGLAEYDRWCAEAGLTLVDRFATWDRRPYQGGGYAVSLHGG